MGGWWPWPLPTLLCGHRSTESAVQPGIFCYTHPQNVQFSAASQPVFHGISWPPLAPALKNLPLPRLFARVRPRARTWYDKTVRKLGQHLPIASGDTQTQLVYPLIQKGAMGISLMGKTSIHKKVAFPTQCFISRGLKEGATCQGWDNQDNRIISHHPKESGMVPLNCASQHGLATQKWHIFKGGCLSSLSEL